MHTDRYYYRWYQSMYNPGDADIACQSVQIVTTSRPHNCPSCNDFKGKVHPAGTRMMRDHAIVDGKWGTAYNCLPCIEAWQRECDPNDVEQYTEATNV
jgi:hypothetical protein